MPKVTSEEKTKPTETDILNEKTAESPLNLSELNDFETENTTQPVLNNPDELILTEAEALEKLPAIPLYFPISFSLVKPYIKGFETNALDAPSLQKVEIDNNWQPTDKKIISNSKN